MAPRKNHIPAYRKKTTKHGVYAVVTLPDGLGRRRDIVLGPYGTKASKAEYVRVLAEWNALGGLAPSITTHADLCVNELLVMYVRHVEAYYRHADGTPTTEVRNIKNAIRWMKQLYGHTAAKHFTTLSLEAIRQAMIDAGLCRNRINKDVARIRRLFRWAGGKRIVPASVFHELATIEGLRAGRSAARETKPVKPVAHEVVERTLPWLPVTIGDMVKLQLESGMRSGELVIMRTADIDRTGAAWAYRPRQHKTLHHRQDRVIWLGPKCQEIVKRYLKADPDAFLFSPADSMRRFREAQHAARKTKVQPSQADRVRHKPRKKAGDRYTPASYGAAIRVCIKRANAAARSANPENPKLIEHWHPHRLRHASATRIRREFGLDVARAVLGHRTPQMAEVYAEMDMGKAADAMARIG